MAGLGTDITSIALAAMVFGMIAFLHAGGLTLAANIFLKSSLKFWPTFLASVIDLLIWLVLFFGALQVAEIMHIPRETRSDMAWFFFVIHLVPTFLICAVVDRFVVVRSDGAAMTFAQALGLQLLVNIAFAAAIVFIGRGGPP